ncbi:hypothetical protein GUITHDRAFT_53660, partial [Guillardia theta CCMP2712]
VGTVWTIDSSEDGSFVVTGGEDGKLVLWRWREDGEGIEEQMMFEGHEGAVYSCCFMPDERWMVSSSQDFTVRRWKREQGWTNAGGVREVFKEKLSGCSITCAAFTPNHLYLLAGTSDHSVVLWSLDKHKLLRTLRGHAAAISCLRVTSDSSKVASGCGKGVICLWQTDTGLRLQRFSEHSDKIHALDLDLSASIMISVAEDATLKLWNLKPATSAPQQTPGLTDGHQSYVRDLAFAPDSKRLISCGIDGKLKLWSLRNGLLLRNLVGHDKEVKQLRVSPDGRVVLSCSLDGTARMWNTDTGREQFMVRETRTGRTLQSFELAEPIDFAADDELVATCSDDYLARVWRVTSDPRLSRVKSLRGHAAAVHCVCFSPDRSLLATGSYDSSVKLWSSQTWKCIATVLGHTNSVHAVAFDMFGQKLVT